MTADRVVIDASVVVMLLIDPGEAGESIAARIADAQLHAPDHLAAEGTNVLRRRRNAGGLSETEARLAIDGFWMLPVQPWPFEVVAGRTGDSGYWRSRRSGSRVRR